MAEEEPELSAAPPRATSVKINPSDIKNKAKRQEVAIKLREEKAKLRKDARRKRQRQREELGEDAPPKRIPRTLENAREVEETTVQKDDEEVVRDEETDEFAPYFSGEKVPKLMITTRPKPSGKIYSCIAELMDLIPNSFYYKRGDFHLKDICRYASNKDFTHLVVLSEKSKVVNGMIVSHLPSGPTACFKLSNFHHAAEISGHGSKTGHVAEVILNRFTTRLGHRVGRFLGSMFPHEPEFKGRQVVTLHNQRDFIFVRHHRYMFDDKGKRAKLQELGPQFTLKMRWLQAGTFDTKQGEYEWFHKRKQMDTSRRKFHM